MFERAMAITAGLLLAAQGLPAQAGETGGQPSDTVPRAMGQGMMMGERTGPGMMGHGMMGHGMMGPGRMSEGGPGPGTLLRMDDVLELSDEQVSRLEAIRGELSPVHRRHMRAAMEARLRAADALDTDAPDISAYESALTEAASEMARAHVAMTRASLRARDVLTEDQRQELQRGLRVMRSMMGGPGMRGRGMHRRMHRPPMPR